VDRRDLRRLIDMIDRQISGIVRLSEDLMDATRVTQGELRPSNANVDVIAVVADPCEMTAAADVAQGQTFTLEMPDRTLRIEGDPVRLTQAVNNRLHNAAKYTPAHRNIKMTVLAEGKDLLISVSDSGLGISDALCRIDRFTAVCDGGWHVRRNCDRGQRRADRHCPLHGG
jgi:signal transduction histidine kinase